MEQVEGWPSILATNSEGRFLSFRALHPCYCMPMIYLVGLAEKKVMYTFMCTGQESHHNFFSILVNPRDTHATH